jgi:DNA repair exonuclease SbcCD nuclease subunit
MGRFIHTADWQLGMTRAFLPAEAQARAAQSRLNAIRRIGDLAKSHSASFVLVSGDVYDSNSLDLQVVRRSLDAMREAGAQFLLLPGNHDCLDPGSIYRGKAFLDNQPENVTVLDGSTPVEISGIEVVAAPWRTKRPTVDLAWNAIKDLGSPANLRLLAAHGAVSTLAPDPSNPAVIQVGRLEKALGDGRIHYVGLGDRHSTTQVDSGGRVWYSGAPEPTDFDEVDPGNALVVDLGDEVKVERVPIAEWSYRLIKQDLADDSDADLFCKSVAALPNKTASIVRATLRGTLSMAGRARLDGFFETEAPAFACFAPWNCDVVTQPSNEDLSQLDLGGYAAAAMTELLDNAKDPETRAGAEGALALLYRLAREEERSP